MPTANRAQLTQQPRSIRALLPLSLHQASVPIAVCSMLAVGCAGPPYALRPTPAPEESAAALQIERQISAVQAQGFEQQGARAIGADERLGGLAIQAIVERLSRVTERPSLHYRAYLYSDEEPNAAALADGRIYLSSGMVEYLSDRAKRAGRARSEIESELAFVLGHELAHTVAQHLVKRYRTLQQQQLLMALLAAGAAVAGRNADAGVQGASRLALDAASLLRDVANSGYSQEQELEADQLGIRYVMRAGFNPAAALDLLQDFSRFDTPSPFLRTHPYISLRREYLQRYLEETGTIGGTSEPADKSRFESALAGSGERGRVEERIKRLREAQKLYPVGSLSWKNLERQIDELERSR